MPELQIDLAVANRFISSLSKSLQALCHGCMDFDSGIEIVGYININIDSGSKVDYVLNEKVLKSTTNSMTFVSNSFLAKKEQPKQTRDGACSPIPQVSPYTPRMQPAYLNSRFQKAGAQVSSYGHNQKGPQKRTRADDLYKSHKKYHLQGNSAESPAPSQVAHSHLMPASASSSYPDLQPPQSNNASDTLQVNIKKETFEADSQQDFDGEHSHNPAGDHNLDSSVNREVQVKPDPDETNSGNKTFSNSESDNTIAGESADLKSNFLEPSLNDSQQAAEESCNQLESESHGSYGAESDMGNNEHSLADKANMPSTSRDNVGETNVMSTENEPESGVSVDYEKSVDDGSYYQRGYDDAGEGSNDAGQFEVIEIDDEDEDVQAMFSDHHQNFLSRGNLAKQHSSFSPTSGLSKVGDFRRNVNSVIYSLETSESFENSFENHCCTHCPEVLPDGFSLRKHLQENHGIVLRHVCRQCGKSYHGRSGLFYHMQASHQMKSFLCPICNAKFTRKSSIKGHLFGVHKMGQCGRCSTLVKYEDYENHMQQCYAVNLDSTASST